MYYISLQCQVVVQSSGIDYEMKMKEPYHHGDLRSALLKGARKLVEKEGVAGLSIRKVARAAGVTHAAPYAHFKSKEQIVIALKEESFRELYEALLEQSPTPKTPEKKLMALARGYVGFQLAHPTKFQIMFRNPLQEADPNRPDVKVGLLIFQRLRAAMEEYLASKRLPKDRSTDLALTAWAMVHGLVSLWIEGPLGYIAAIDHRDTKGFEARAEKAVRDFLKSIR